MTNQFSFCESVAAGSRSRWHIRRLTSVGKKLGGGVDTSSLCGHVKPRQGWDLDVELTEHHLTHACPKCVDLYRQAMTNPTIDLSHLNQKQFDVLSQFCVNNSLGHDLDVVQQLLDLGLLGAARDEETNEPVPVVPPAVHLAWASRCAEMHDAIAALPSTLHAITLWQPWASLVAFGVKTYETRSWATPHRGPLVIHSAKRLGADQRDLCATEPYRTALFGTEAFNLPLGAALCVVDLVEVHRIDVKFRKTVPAEQRPFGDFSIGRFAWELANVRPLLEPVPLSGKQSIWTVEKKDLMPYG